ncbi:unnamed protein product [Pelagomonas calceolata]|uniref:Uncharacterized protein n=1 Tax=Pelagomonas calceolata TaxID=35677 RepID=A0A8J2SY60_9STRA|nr:unnamed protein product [Pelagomonas calceolata]
MAALSLSLRCWGVRPSSFPPPACFAALAWALARSISRWLPRVIVALNRCRGYVKCRDDGVLRAETAWRLLTPCRGPPEASLLVYESLAAPSNNTCGLFCICYR